MLRPAHILKMPGGAIAAAWLIVCGAACVHAQAREIPGALFCINDFVCLALEPVKYEPSDVFAEALEGPLAGIDEVVFAVRQPGKDGHWYANFSYYAADANRLTYGDGGRLCRLNLRSGELTLLVDDPQGGVRDPQIHYDGEKILFSYRKGGTEYYHLYEINVDGTGLRQLTDGPYDDFEPTYLPDGGIMFCSSRCNRWVNCWLTKVAVLYRCDADGGKITEISSNNEHDNTPWPLPDGRILYQRWEYVDRSQVHYHHLWTTNPDGTGQMVYFGNMNAGTVMIDAKPIPDSRNVLAVFSPGHGRREHDGAIAVIDPRKGPDNMGFVRIVNDSPAFRDPYPLTDDYCIAARGAQLVAMNGRGQFSAFYSLSNEDRKAGLECHEPRPLRPRKREGVIAPRVASDQTTGRLILADIYEGRNMAGVRRGEIKRLLVLETLPKPVNFTGGMEPLSYGGTFTLERIVGTVPVEPDGSAYVELPSNRSFFFVALDEQDLSVKRMQSFLTVMPGETTSCVGCHEQRTQTPLNPSNMTLQALERAPSAPEPIADVPDVLDFPRDIQPILDKHCSPCHGYEESEKGKARSGGVILTGDRGPLYSHSYFTLSVRQQIADGRNRPQSNYAPRGIGSSASPLMKKILEKHHGVDLSELEAKTVRLWLDTGAPYPGTYAGLGTGMIGGYEQNQIDRSDTGWPGMKAAMETMIKRCGACHEGALKLPTSPTDNMGMPPWAIHYGDPRLRFSRHILYNLSRPERSLLLLAPLAKEAGGYGICATPDAQAQETPPPAGVFLDTTDADYQALLTAIRDTKARLDEVKRFDMAGFRPRHGYIREMQRYGILPMDLGENIVINSYETDRMYWRSLWPQSASRADSETLE